MIETVLYDFDGPLVDSAPLLFSYAQYICDFLGTKISIHSVEEFRRMPTDPYPFMYETLTNLPWSSIESVVEGEFQPFMTGKVSPLQPGMKDLVSTLYQNGISQGIVSSNHVSIVKEVLEHHVIDQYFRSFRGKENTTYLKPHPEAILAGIAELDSDSSSTLYIGDQPTDFAAARAARVHFLPVCAGFGYKEKWIDHGVKQKDIALTIEDAIKRIKIVVNT